MAAANQIGVSSTTHPMANMAVIAVVMIATPLLLNVGSLTMSPVRLMLLLVTVPLLVQLFAGKYGRFTVIDGLMLAYAFWQLVAVGVNNPDRLVQFGGSNVLDFLGGYLIGRAAVRTPRDFRRLTWALFIICLFLLPFAFIEARTGRAMLPYILSRVGLPVITDFVTDKRLGMYRSQVVFYHQIHYGLFCSMMLSLVVMGLRDQLSVLKRVLGACAIVCGTIFSVSSGAVLPLFLQFILIAWAVTMAGVSRRWLIFTILMAVLYAIAEVLSDRSAVVAILSKVTFNSHNVYMRTFIFDWGMVNVWANPIFGLGLRDWVRASWMSHLGSVDNFWLLQAMRYGIPAFLFLAVGTFLAMFQVGRRRFTSGSELSNCQLAWMLTMLSLVLTLCTVHVWGPVHTLFMMMISSGLWMLTAEETDEDTQTEPEAASSGHVYSRFPAKPASGGATPIASLKGDRGPARPASYTRRDLQTPYNASGQT
ncbi:O-antigen ligase family protein [Primorskyibacter sp. S187A]|uniref:O-antigen ligase family protein n=1 Tax=Primorskyibacter sp. S187A TaxID=3415130 RepID=UPI003C79A9F6